MHGLGLRKGLVLLIALFLVYTTGQLEARAAQETEEAHLDEDEHDDHEDEHNHEGEMVIPHIEPASLGAGDSLKVIATTSIVGDVVLQVAGSSAAVEVLMPIGQNPHSYEPTPRAIASLEKSYIVFVNGLDLEEALMEMIENVAGTHVVPISAGIAGIGGEDDHDDHDDHDEEGEDDDRDNHENTAGDPHFWFDPNNVIVWAENIAEALSEADPANGSAYEANRDAYVAQLEALDLEIRTKVSSIPRNRRKLVVDHVALTYFAEEYGFEIIGEVVPSISDQAEPSARHIAELAGVINKEDVSAIFVGDTAGRGLLNLVKAVAKEVGREVQIVELLSGSLAPEGSRGDTYLEFILFNAEQIVSALSR